MTTEEHRKKHVELHRALRELVADWLREPDSWPGRTPVFELIEWSHAQTINPTPSPSVNEQ
jgi:hypothetical protein